MKNKKKLLVITLTWNDYSNTNKCIQSFKKHSKKYDIHYLLIDNNSTDGSYEKIINKYKFLKIENKKFSKISYRYLTLKNNNNMGCGAGHNPGYQFGIKNNFQYIARIDNDMTFGKNFFNENIEILDKNISINAISPKILYTNNKNKIWWMGCVIGQSLKFQTHMRNYPYGLIDSCEFNGLINTDAIAGCASIIRVSRLKKIGLSDVDFFYGPEDVEFSRRIFNKKGSLIVNLDSKIYHKVSQSFKENLQNRRMYFEYKYRLLLIKKIGTQFDKLIGYTISLVKFIIYIFLFSSKRHRQKIIPVGKAIIDFFLFNRLGNYDRKNNNK
jgi:hypothetical protein